ncbi:MAG: cobalamin biosynthesis protein [Lachnospiraceae bacterium]|nr:cobalamin biosynthesis protein [Lachnospiraceae bacterium]
MDLRYYSICIAVIAGALTDRFIGHGREPLSSVLPRRFTSFVANALYRGPDSDNTKSSKGLILTLLVTSLFTGLAFILVLLSSKPGPVFETVVSAFLFYLTISAGTIRKTASKVNESLRKNRFDEKKAERAIRDIARSVSSKIVAPIFFMVIGGPVFAVFYKIVDILREFTGAGTRYNSFSRYAYILSDFLEFFPARIAALIMLEASYLMKLDSRSAFRIFVRDRKMPRDLNSGQTVSMAAGALGIRFTEDGVPIGDHVWNVSAEDVNRISRLSDITELITLILFCAIRLLATGKFA